MITAERNQAGAWRLSAFVGEGAGEYLLTRSYYFTTKAEALKLFKREIKEAGE